MRTIVAFWLLLASFPLMAWEDNSVTALLEQGNQRGAEEKVASLLREDPRNPDLVFWSAVLARSRFTVNMAVPGFAYVAKARMETPEGLASACVLGLDLSAEERSALYYYNALLVVASQNPNSVPIHWMAAVAARTLTSNDSLVLADEARKRILRCGVAEYEKVLSLLPNGPGPALVHQTLANLLDDMEAYDRSLEHRTATLRLERAAWSLHATAWTLHRLARYSEALPLAQEAIVGSPQNGDYYDTLGNLFWGLKKFEEAGRAYDKASELDPRGRGCAYRSFFAQKTLGNYVGARERTKRWLATFDSDKEFQIWNARFAVMLNEPGAAEELLKAGTFNFKGRPVALKPSRDPWFLAAQTGDVRTIRSLLGRTDVNLRNTAESNTTALMYAAQAGWEPILVELIRAGADLNLVDGNGDSALHYAAQFRQPRMIQLLLEAGAKTDMEDRWKQTPLIMSACERDWDAFALVLAKSDNLELATPHGGTALHYASGYGELGMIRPLLERGANVNARCARNQWTPLIGACSEWAHSYVVQPLLEAGAELNARDRDGRTALHHSIDPLMNPPLVELLLQRGADPSLADNFGVTPIRQARLLGFEQTARAMEEKCGHPEPLRFPDFEIVDNGLSADEKNASYFVFPILLGEGHPLGRPSWIPPGDKAAAQKELKRMFGIQNANDLKEELQALESFEPKQRESAGELTAAANDQQLKSLLANAVSRIHESVAGKATDELAYTQAHIIYLSDIGMSAGFLSAEEAARRIAKASLRISERFKNWTDFLVSFRVGCWFHNGWEAVRYENIGRQIEAANLQWP